MSLEAKYLVDLLRVNVDNEKLSDAEFREFVRTSLPLYITADNKKEKGAPVLHIPGAGGHYR